MLNSGSSRRHFLPIKRHAFQTMKTNPTAARIAQMTNTGRRRGPPGGPMNPISAESLDPLPFFLREVVPPVALAGPLVHPLHLLPIRSEWLGILHALVHLFSSSPALIGELACVLLDAMMP